MKKKKKNYAKKLTVRVTLKEYREVQKLKKQNKITYREMFLNNMADLLNYKISNDL